MIHANLKEYVQKWKSIDGIKPKNEDQFIDRFIDLLNSIDDDRDISFDGDGSYFGKQVTLSYGSGVWAGDKDLSFEICYTDKEISVYRKDHDGFWVPEYMRIKSGIDSKFNTVSNSLFPLLRRAFGIEDKPKKNNADTPLKIAEAIVKHLHFEGKTDDKGWLQASI